METEYENKAKWVADLMKADGVTADQFGAMDEVSRLTLMIGYMDVIGKKIEKIQSICLTRHHQGATQVIGRMVSA